MFYETYMVLYKVVPLYVMCPIRYAHFIVNIPISAMCLKIAPLG